MLRNLLAYGAAIAVLACSPTEPTAADLRRNMELWEARGPSNYRLTIHRGGCECLPEHVIPITVHVRDNVIHSVINADTEEPVTVDLFHAMTVRDLFALIEQAIAQNAHRLTVRYDRSFGFPRSIFIDDSAAMVDDETSLIVNGLSQTGDAN